MIKEVAQAIAASDVRRVGILGTLTVMTSRFYGGITIATVLTPVGDDLERVHNVYVTMAVTGAVTDAQRAILHSAAYRLREEQGAKAIMLGGTDLALVFAGQTTDYPLIDCAAIHVDAISARALACH